MSQFELAERLQRRRRELSMSASDLARRSGVSRATVLRILSGTETEFAFSNLQAITEALGMTIDLCETPAEQFKDQVATQKARRIVALTQGNVALECQAVGQSSIDAQIYNVKTRIASSSRKLWAS